MATPGKKPKSTEVKRLAGNPSRRPLNESDPQPQAGEPAMPQHLCEEAREAWRWLCGQLKCMGILAKSDTAIMAIYCETWTEYVKARTKVEETGMITISKNKTLYMSPWLNVEAMLKKQLVSAAAELGLTPTARTRIKVIEEPPQTSKGRFFQKNKGMKIVG